MADREGLPHPAEDDLLVGDQPADAQPVDADPVDVGAARARRGRWRWRRASARCRPSRRAAAISSAVRRAVPDGASALSGWCSSTTSTDSKNGAAWAAKRIIRIAPMEKLGAIRTPGPRARRPSHVAQLVEPGVVEAGGADDGVDAVLDAEARGCPSPRRGG